MKPYWIKTAALTVCVLMLCALTSGCNDATNDGATTTTIDPLSITRPTVVLKDATGSVFVGTWNVTCEKGSITMLQFNENGSVVVTLTGGTLGGTFTIDSDTHMTLHVSQSDMVTEYTVDGDTITLVSETDTMVLTRA